MKIVTVIMDGAGRVRLCATRSPDLLRRQVAAETGHADLVGVSLAPDGLGPQALIARPPCICKSTRSRRASTPLHPP